MIDLVVSIFKCCCVHAVLFNVCFLLCAQVSQMYDDTKLLMTAEPVKDYIPYSWVSMATVKAQYYMALAHTHMATAIIEFAGECESPWKELLNHVSSKFLKSTKPG